MNAWQIPRPVDHCVQREVRTNSRRAFGLHFLFPYHEWCPRISVLEFSQGDVDIIQGDMRRALPLSGFTYSIMS